MALAEAGELGGQREESMERHTVLVVDHICSNINVEVDRVHYVPCNLCPDICVAQSINNPTTKKEDRPGAK